MKKIAAFALLLLLAAPALAMAQGSDDDWMNFWRRGSSYQTQIQALGDTPVAAMPIPVLLGVEVNQLYPNFGDPRGGGTRTHEGLDIIAPSGTPVVSPTDAVVLSTGDGADSGLYVRTANPGGEQFVYMHLNEIAKGISSGVVLKRGEVLGYVGNTGNASGGGAHLHFEIRKNGATDPLPRLTQVFSLQERMSAVQQALERTTDTNLAQTLVTNFKSTFTSAKSQGISLSQSILTHLGTGIVISVPTAAAQSATAPTSASVVVMTGNTRDLELGMKGEDVRTLQKFLNASGFMVAATDAGSPGYETTYFGALTQKALAKYQAAHAITPSVGYFGPKTRAYIGSH
jgi:hypothetical protein